MYRETTATMADQVPSAAGGEVVNEAVPVVETDAVAAAEPSNKRKLDDVLLGPDGGEDEPLHKRTVLEAGEGAATSVEVGFVSIKQDCPVAFEKRRLAAGFGRGGAHKQLTTALAPGA